MSNYYDEAVKAAERGQHNQSRKLLDQALQHAASDNERAQAYTLYAGIACKSSRFRTGLGYARQAADLWRQLEGAESDKLPPLLATERTCRVGLRKRKRDRAAQ